MSDVAAYHVFVCALSPVQGGMWTAARETTHTQTHDAATSLIIMEYS
jgi:hypothetical protein